MDQPAARGEDWVASTQTQPISSNCGNSNVEFLEIMEKSGVKSSDSAEDFNENCSCFVLPRDKFCEMKSTRR